jgi:SAM-dependent methyltransferase
MTALTQPKALVHESDFEFAALEQARNYRNALLRTFAEHLRGRVLEVGAGVGQLTGLLLQCPAIRQLVSVEPDGKFCERLRAAFPVHTIVQGTINDLTSPENWDAILSVNVLEHIEHDERELEGYRRLLQQQRGVFCLFVPACPEIYAPLDKQFGHFRRYARPQLKHKLEQAGFRVLQLYYFNFVGYLTWWLSFCVLKKRSFNPAAVRWFDRLVFPSLYQLETRVLRPPFGQSLVAVARAG